MLVWFQMCTFQTQLGDWYLEYWGTHYPGINATRHYNVEWRHNGHDGVSNHQPHEFLLNRLFRLDQRKHQSSASLALVWGSHRGPVNSPLKGPVTRKMFPFDDVIMSRESTSLVHVMAWCRPTRSHLPKTMLMIPTPYSVTTPQRVNMINNNMLNNIEVVARVQHLYFSFIMNEIPVKLEINWFAASWYFAWYRGAMVLIMTLQVS